MANGNVNVKSSITTTNALILSYIVIFLLRADPLKWGFTPSLFWNNPLKQAITLISNTFIHGGVRHLVFNSISLYQFGNVVEKVVGSSTYSVLYLVFAAIESLVYALLVPTSSVPSIGASGVISSFVAIYFLFFRNSGALSRVLANEVLGLMIQGFSRINYLGHIIGLAVGAGYYILYMK